MEQNPNPKGIKSETHEIPESNIPRLTDKPRFTMASIVKKEGRWKVLGFTIEAWLLAFLVALALPYINIVAIPVMFFVFAGALAIHTVWTLFKLV